MKGGLKNDDVISEEKAHFFSNATTTEDFLYGTSSYVAL